MVLNDDHLQVTAQPKQSRYKLSETLPSAKLFDRIAAFIVDYSIILSPLIWLFISPFKKQLGVFTLTGEGFLSSIVAVNMTLVIASLSFLYCFLFTSAFGATLGQIFFKLRVRSIAVGQKLSLFDAFIRSLVFTVTLMFFGLPLFFMFLHKGQKTLHELLSDTYTISLVKNKFPKLYNVFYFRVIFVCFSIIMFMSLLMGLRSYFEVTSMQSASNETVLCDDVSESVQNWPDQGEVIPKRLSVAMALYAIDAVGAECLDIEADYVFGSGEESELAYLAKAFVHAGEADRSDEYLDKVCQSEDRSEACDMSKVIDGWATDNYELVEEILSSLVTDTAYVNLWKTRFYLSRGDYKNALYFVNSLPKVSALSRFASMNKAKLYWYTKDYKLSSALLDSVLEKENDVDSIDMSSWMCSEELQLSCSNVGSSSCKYLEQKSKQEDFAGNLAFLQKLDCEGAMGTHRRYSWNNEMGQLIEQLSKINSNEEALINFVNKKFITNKNIPLFAVSKYLKSQDEVSESLLESLVSFTSQVGIKYNQEKVSNEILQVFMDNKDYEMAFNYGKNFTEDRSEKYLQNMVVSSYYSDHKDLSNIYLNNIELDKGKEVISLRGIASKDEFGEIKEALQEDSE